MVQGRTMNVEKYFSTGNTVKADGMQGEVDVSVKGPLQLPTGQVAIGDADYYQVERAASRGSYPVSVSIARGRTPYGHQYSLVGLVRVDFAREAPAAWEPAWLVDFDGSRTDWFAVDSGTFAVFDSSVQQAWTQELSERVVESGSEFRRQHRWFYANERFDQANPDSPNVIAVSTNGDGTYRAYWLTDELGCVTSLVVDLCVYDDLPWS